MRYENLFISFLLTASVHASAQLQEINSKVSWTTIGEVKWINTIKARLQYSNHGQDTLYWLYLKDEKTLKNTRDMPVVNYFSIQFKNEGGALEALQLLLLSFFAEENARDKKYQKTFRLGNTMVLVQHYQKITARALLFTTKEGSVILNKTEIRKLFRGAGE